MKNLIKIGLGCDDLRVDKHVMKLIKSFKIQKFFRNHSNLPWNFAWFDFIDFDPTFICFLLGLNFPKTLIVIRAVATCEGTTMEYDVKEIVKSLTTRSNSVYLVNIWEDLCLTGKKGEFEISFRFEGEPISHQKIEFEKGDSYLLNFLTYK